MEWVIALLLGLAGGGAGVYFYLKIAADKAILGAHENAKNIIEDSEREAATFKQEKLIEAEEEIFEQKQRLEQAYEGKKNQLSQLESKLDQREIEIDRKSEIVQKKERETGLLEKQLSDKAQAVHDKDKSLTALLQKEHELLEEISGYTRIQARDALIKDMEEDARKEGNRLGQNIIDQAQLEANRKAQEIVVQAIQQIAAEQSVEATVSVVTLPDDDMKGRIIGREGRNIRAFEHITGVDVIIDDTPEIVVLSSYNSYRREIAKLSLDKLINDGRIHPARIEEVVEKTTEEMKLSLMEIGEQTVLDLGLHGVAEEVMAVIGKLKYRTSYGQNVLNHSKEVANLCGIMAAELGLDVRRAKRAGILHDIGKGLDNFTEANHATMGADFLRKHNEHEIVVNVAECHHDDEAIKSTIGILVAVCDKISGSRPGARRESLESFIKRMDQLEDIATGFNGVEKSFAIQAGREIRVIAETAEVDDALAKALARDIAKKIQLEIEFPGQIKVSVIREFRTFSIAT